MRAGECGNSTGVVVAQPETGIVEAAALMREYHVGTLVIVEIDGDDARPVGIVTDRDLVVEVLASGAPTERFTVGDVMSTQIIVAGEDDDLFETLERMHHAGVRRVPLVNASGKLAGILSIDDVLEYFADVFAHVPRLVRRQRDTESLRRP